MSKQSNYSSYKVLILKKVLLLKEQTMASGLLLILYLHCYTHTEIFLLN